MDAMDFTNKVVVITGASSGIGAETAKVFAENKAKLTLVGRDKTRLNNTAKQCENRNGFVPLCVHVDLTHAGSCEAVISKTMDAYGKINVLINCAGKVILSSLFDNSMETFDELMTINFRVPYHLSQLALPHLIKTKGNIINIGSSMSKRFKPGILPYIVSKTALETFTKHAAPELVTEGVRINTISPGTTRTNILENLNIKNTLQQMAYEKLAEEMPNGKVIEPREVAMLICLTASDVFPNLNGSDLLIDGAACMA